MSFLLGIYSSETIAVSERALFTRVARAGAAFIAFSYWNRRRKHFVSFLKHPCYFTNNMVQTRGTGYTATVCGCMVLRTLEEIFLDLVGADSVTETALDWLA